ncbi:MAG: hypothetical protein Kow00109_02240 [Acidobacteriota bacterium]
MEHDASNMVKVTMPIPEPRSWEFPAGKRVGDVLRELQLNPEAVIVVAGDTLLTADRRLEAGQDIEILPVISGGSERAEEADEVHQV